MKIAAETFDCTGEYDGETAKVMRKAIWSIIDDMAEKIQSQQSRESRAKKSAVLGAQVAVLRVLQARVGEIEIIQ